LWYVPGVLQTQSQPTFLASEIVPGNYFELLDLKPIFGPSAPVEIDLGCGDGTFLTELAQTNPDRDYLGIERLPGRVLQTNGKIVRGELSNARVLWIETSYAIRYMLESDSVSIFHLMFPDPWPKRRHQRRRIVTKDFFSSIHTALIPDGLFRIVTDQIDYFREVERLIDSSAEFARMPNQSTAMPVSTFEKRLRDRGAEIHSLLLQKVSALT
jgi:tRNA (guanine-N7-)-methyltransferase